MVEITKSSHFIPEGWHTVIPRIVAHDAEHLVEFLRHVFGAEGEYRQDRPAEVRIGDSLIMVSDAGIRSPMAAFLYVYVEDNDATYLRALDAGATSLEEPFNTPYGDRSEAATEMTPAVNGDLAVRLGIALVEALAEVVAGKKMVREGAEPAMRDRVRPPFDHPGIEPLALFDQFPASVDMAVTVAVERPQTLSENARVVDGADYERRAKNE
jgi:PhnB protein